MEKARIGYSVTQVSVDEERYIEEKPVVDDGEENFLGTMRGFL